MIAFPKSRPCALPMDSEASSRAPEVAEQSASLGKGSAWSAVPTTVLVRL